MPAAAMPASVDDTPYTGCCMSDAPLSHAEQLLSENPRLTYLRHAALIAGTVTLRHVQ